MCRSTLFRLRLRTHSLTTPRSPIPRTFLLIYSTELAFLLHRHGHGGRARGVKVTVLRRETDTEKAPEKAHVI